MLELRYFGAQPRALRLERVRLDKRTDMSAPKGYKFAKKRPGEKKDKCL
jgi:hypothetical protein